MDILNIVASPPATTPTGETCPKPTPPFSNISALAVTLLTVTIFNFFLRYVYVKTPDSGFHAATIIIAAVIYGLCIGFYLNAAFRHQKKSPNLNDPSVIELILTVFFQIMFMFVTYYAAVHLLKR